RTRVDGDVGTGVGGLIGIGDIGGGNGLGPRVRLEGDVEVLRPTNQRSVSGQSGVGVSGGQVNGVSDGVVEVPVGVYRIDGDGELSAGCRGIRRSGLTSGRAGGGGFTRKQDLQLGGGSVTNGHAGAG